MLDRQFGLNRGFDHYDDNVRTGEYRAFSYQERAANQLTEAVVNYLPQLKKSGKPFFLWVHYYDAHYPYVAPNPFIQPQNPRFSSPLSNNKTLYQALRITRTDS